LGEIKIVSFNFPPKGWAFCNGQLLPINQNQALFSLFGTTYGGNGQTNFGLPDFRGRSPNHWGGNFTLGQRAGEQTHTVTQSELPQHTHPMFASTTATGNTNSPSGTFPATDPINAYRSTTNTVLWQSTITNAGGSQPHENRQPYLVLNFIVALQGIFPSRN
jgi:microcystin-dependent protein